MLTLRSNKIVKKSGSLICRISPSVFIYTPLGGAHKCSYFGNNFTIIRFFSDRKVAFIRDLNTRHIASHFLNLSVEKMVDLLKEVGFLEEKYRNDVDVSMETELLGYNIKKKLFLLEKEISMIIDEEIGAIDNIIIILADKPDWLLGEELGEVIEDLRLIIGIFFRSIETIRVTGELYLRDKDQLKDFVKYNKLFEHTAAAKTCIGLLTIDLKKNLPYLSVILKEVQRRWSWLTGQQREEVVARLKIAYAEKKKTSLERKKSRKKQDKLLKRLFMYSPEFKKK